mmetsp:Transcript_28310/g.43871  ORF Transcript_28310/g.43871 Transcript_28310/m.43871 type:complete len:294 (-) Transcript_28310:144-1025(-)|eukprot:CAMPEP_0201521594 /NCGR_PEP_ID=MMETSP0161_2-20130828/15032_1 /ASSEMBLY_ACC=CAM_ASM_000251 /TAXON_ID=180227 /ORGANISM="Neoparamoeba aestuarina, Strain SoJaBio B1-5/56/2" /LENGTH=293 /DNA_ID=CAMNT_0047920251 /DNA_START=163 /DNA_END=1044 /DNA_ORIENTATION=+
MLGSLFGSNAQVTIELGGCEKRQQLDVKKGNGFERQYLFYGKEAIKGVVHVKPSKKIEHNGGKIELVGCIEIDYDRGSHYTFTTTERQIPPGDITSPVSFDFDFSNVPKPHESYYGAHVKLRYFVRFDMAVKNSLSSLNKELGFLVHNFQVAPEVNNGIKMEVGIEDCMHIEFEYNKARYHLKDVIIGKVFFILVRIKIKNMELSLIKKETLGSNDPDVKEQTAVIKYEIMEGAPVKGETVPVRLFLGGFDLTPTYRNVHKKFNVRYYLNLVLVDEGDRRYFKQQEVTLWRKR